MCRITDEKTMLWSTFQNDSVRANDAMITDFDRTDDGRVGINDAVITDFGMTVDLFKGVRTKGYPVVEYAVVADDGGFTDHETHAMIDEDA